MTTFLETIIASAILVIALVLFESIFKHLDEKQFKDELTSSDEIMLIKNDDEINKYIKFFQNAIGNPYKKCHISHKMMMQFKKSYNDIQMIRVVASVLLNHIGLSQSPLFIEFNHCDEGNAGNYTNTFIPRITINMKEDYSYMNVLAILCHECTHHFMNTHKIRNNNEIINEKMTDVLSIYLGFDKYIESGYAPVKKIKDKECVFTNSGIITRYNIQTSFIGYLDESKINYTIRKVNRLRKKYFFVNIYNKINLTKKIHDYTEQTHLKSVTELQKTFTTKYNIYFSIIERHKEIVDIIVSKKITSMEFNDIETIQDYLSGNFEFDFVNPALKMMHNQDYMHTKKRTLKKYINKLNKLSTTLTQLNVRLSKYL